MVNGLELITLALFCFKSFLAFPGVVGVHNYGKSIVIKGGEKKMDINTKKVKLVKYGKGLRLHPLIHRRCRILR